VIEPPSSRLLGVSSSSPGVNQGARSFEVDTAFQRLGQFSKTLLLTKFVVLCPQDQGQCLRASTFFGGTPFALVKEPSRLERPVLFSLVPLLTVPFPFWRDFLLPMALRFLSANSLPHQFLKPLLSPLCRGIPSMQFPRNYFA